MSVPANIFQLNARNALIKVPQTYGLYTLFDGHGSPIYYGKAETVTLRERLLLHINKQEPGLENACFFCVELVQSVSTMWHLIAKADVHYSQPFRETISCFKQKKQISRQLAIDGILYSAYMN